VDNKELEKKLQLLEKRINAQEKELTTLKDIEAIKKLQKAYGYYVEHMMYQEIVDCFADSPEVRLDWLEGKWLGKEGMKKYFSFIQNRPLNFQHQVMQIAGIVDIDPDGQQASGRWYAFGAMFFPQPEGMKRSFVAGIYEMRYIKEDGVWKILSISWVIPYGVTVSGEWRMPEDVNRPYLAGQWRGPAPDIPIDREDQRYITGYIFPFHYNHPVSGKPTSENEKNARLKEPK